MPRTKNPTPAFRSRLVRRTERWQDRWERLSPLYARAVLAVGPIAHLTLAEIMERARLTYEREAATVAHKEALFSALDQIRNARTEKPLARLAPAERRALNDDWNFLRTQGLIDESDWSAGVTRIERKMGFQWFLARWKSLRKLPPNRRAGDKSLTPGLDAPGFLLLAWWEATTGKKVTLTRNLRKPSANSDNREYRNEGIVWLSERLAELDPSFRRSARTAELRAARIAKDYRLMQRPMLGADAE